MTAQPETLAGARHTGGSTRYVYAAVLLLASTLAVMAGAIVMPVVELIRNDLGISGTAVGFVVTAHAIVIAAVSPFVGRAIDRWGVRIPLGAGLMLYGIAGGAGLITTSYPVLIGSRLVLGVGAAAVFSGTTVALLTVASGEQQDRIIGWRTTAMTAGGLVWPVLAGALGGIGWHATFGIYVLGVPLGIATLVLAPRDRPAHSTDRAEQGSALGLMRRYPTLIAWYAMMALTGFTMYSLVIFLPQRLPQIGIPNPMFVSLFMAVQAIAASVVGLGFARIRRRAGFGALLRMVAVCRTAAFLILAMATHPLAVLAAGVVIGVSNGLSLPVTTLLVGETTAPSRRGLAISLSGTAVFIGQFSTPLILGPVTQAASITTGYLLIAGVSASVLLLLRHRIRDPREAESKALP